MFPRRDIVKGAATLPLAAVLANPILAQAAAAGLQQASITTADGRQVSGALATPAETPAPAVLLIHEWWGLNDQIKSVAAEFAQQGYLALAADLYGGTSASTPEEARSLMQQVEKPAAIDTLASWAEWLDGHEMSTGKVGVVGWCFGGGWSLMTAIHAPVDAAVVYYGNVARTAEELASLQAPVLGHFATQDRNIDKPMVEGFEQAMDKAGKQVTTYWYEANHAFANPTGNRYDQADAQLAWKRTLAFLDEYLKA